MLYWAIFFIIILLTLISLIKINIAIEILKNNNDDHLIISAFSFGGILKYKYEIPFLSFDDKGVKIRTASEHGKKEKNIRDKLNEFEYKDIIKKLKEVRILYRKNHTVISTINSYIARKIVIEDIRLNILAGVGEAHYTAILNGFLWTICGSALSFLCNKLKVKNKNMEISSDFSEMKLLIDFYCIFNFKIVHIIVVAIKLLNFYIRGKLNIKIKTVGGGLSG